MDTRVATSGDHAYLESVPGTGRIGAEQDATDLIAACFAEKSERLLLHADNLDPAFYDLRNGLAGAVLQKFVNYRVRVALVIPGALGEAPARFREMVGEANRGNHFRVFAAREPAEAWLVAD